MYGSFNSDFTTRDHNLYTTTIDATTSDLYSIEINSISNIRIDGFTIIGGRSNVGGIFTYGIHAENSSSIIIQNNDIFGGTTSVNNSNSIGIYIGNSTLDIINNTIYSGTTGGAGSSFGIYITDNSSTPTVNIRNNTINGGSGGLSSVGICQDGSIVTYIQNNIIFALGGTSTYGFFEADVNSDPTEFQNNNIFDCDTLYYNEGSDLITLLIDINGMAGTDSSSNIKEDLISPNPPYGEDFFVDVSASNWHLKDTTPSSVTKGGLNGIDEGWGFKIDKDGIERPESTKPWSMGAYEPL